MEQPGRRLGSFRPHLEPQRFEGLLAAGNDQAGTPQRQLKFGPRWQNLVQVRFGSSQGLAFIRLPEAFQDDLTTFALHPARARLFSK